MSSEANILRMKNDFSESKRHWSIALGSQASLVALTAIATLFPETGVAAGLLALAGTVFFMHQRELADEHYERAEAIRRITLLSDALRLDPDPADVADIAATTTSRPSGDPLPEGSYYNSPIQAGPRRLAHILWESAHFTSHQAKEVAGTCHTAVRVGWLLVVIVLVLVISQSGSPIRPGEHPTWLVTHGANVAGAACVLLSLFGLGLLGELEDKFSSLAKISSVVCRRCKELTTTRVTRLEQVLFALDQYNCALARSAPIPSYVWTRRQKQITESWAEASKLIKP